MLSSLNIELTANALQYQPFYRVIWAILQADMADIASPAPASCPAGPFTLPDAFRSMPLLCEAKLMLIFEKSRIFAE